MTNEQKAILIGRKVAEAMIDSAPAYWIENRNLDRLTSLVTEALTNELSSTTSYYIGLAVGAAYTEGEWRFSDLD